MKQFSLNFFRSNKEIKDFAVKVAHLQSEQSRRSAVPIAVIDDQPFAAQTNLQSYGYNISQIGDIKSLGEVARYPLILCDIMGVGRHFDSKLQGASLISEIKKGYPEKIVIAYTGAGLSERAVKVAGERSDKIVKKDIDIEELVEILDGATRLAVDPHVVWNKVRARFIEMDVDTKDILRLEDGYVRSVLRKDSDFVDFKQASGSGEIRQDARAIVNGLMSSAIFSAIFGA